MIAGSTVTVEFCGEFFEVPADREYTIGRAGDLAIDDNPLLHRRFLVLSSNGDRWWLFNAGSRIPATLTDDAGLTQTSLAPGGAVPLVHPRVEVRFSAGRTTYEFIVHLGGVAPQLPDVRHDDDGTKTIGVPVSLSDNQRLTLLVLARFALEGVAAGGARIPSTRYAARELGWTEKSFDRSVDEVCRKLAEAGVPGLVGGRATAAQDRRARLIEYAVSSRMVCREDLVVLGRTPHPQGSPER